MQFQGMVSQNTYQKVLGAADSLEPKASRLFEKALRSPNGLHRLLGQQVQPIPVFDEVYAQARMKHQYDMGTRSVRLDQIVGTLNRDTDFDARFRPIQRHSENRWLRVATAMLRGVDLPPLELVKVGDQYFVKDGHHRVSVARALGYQYLDAHISAYEFEEAA